MPPSLLLFLFIWLFSRKVVYFPASCDAQGFLLLDKTFLHIIIPSFFKSSFSPSYGEESLFYVVSIKYFYEKLYNSNFGHLHFFIVSVLGVSQVPAFHLTLRAQRNGRIIKCYLLVFLNHHFGWGSTLWHKIELYVLGFFKSLDFPNQTPTAPDNFSCWDRFKSPLPVLRRYTGACTPRWTLLV